ncbi:hypothetical protein JCM3774_005593 [Rhodotorula dairenensis]
MPAGGSDPPVRAADSDSRTLLRLIAASASASASTAASAAHSHELVDDTGWLAADYDDFTWRERELPSVWRNDPLSVPRLSALPRGGRTLHRLPSPASAAAAASPIPAPVDAVRQVDHTAARVPRDYSHRGSLDPRAVPPRLAHAIRRQPIPGAAASSSSSEESSSGQSQQRFGVQVPDNLVLQAGSYFASVRQQRGGGPMSLQRSQDGVWQDGDREEEGDDDDDEGSAATTWQPQPQRPRRTREETNAMMGAALRSKKPVYLLYCGDDGSVARAKGQECLPTGFTSGDIISPSTAAAAAATQGGKGCGALVCARALLDGVPDKLFTDPLRAAERAASSDLPPRADRVADLEGDGVGERVGKRGWKTCRGCVTRDVACTRCGNVLGYRLLKPCVGCSISRPTYTTYASAVTNDSANGRGSVGSEPRPILSAGGVTGGGVVDGLLFHFRLGAVTPLPRRIGVRPADELPLCSERDVETVTPPAVVEEEPASGSVAQRDGMAIPGGGGRRGRRTVSLTADRLKEKQPKPGEHMTWKHIPTAQRDFVSGLVGEPSDWISPSSETWWLDHAIVKHSRKRSAGAAFVNPNRSDFNPDSLSAARTTVDSSGGISQTSPNTSPLRSSLSRSHAIRVRVPLSNAHPASAIAAASVSSTLTDDGAAAAASSYDRYRHDASDFARRVRQRYADPSASDSAVVTSLARAGYGSGFADELEEETDAAACPIPGLRGRETIGR